MIVIEAWPTNVRSAFGLLIGLVTRRRDRVQAISIAKYFEHLSRIRPCVG